ncbi:serine/threonine-protein kinase-like protein CCR4 [Andrographis paniculata]|uniref:serine/threonine-protein kinase-like protein CCR4 n=1 Tax=Andrographis paniculata TaxID=175694 RepID=UPI0021E7DB0A|nr:serine/threonine-protein kinase-like protein CCR4 [Andrographis paniculata]
MAAIPCVIASPFLVLLLALSLVSLFPSLHSLSTVAISENNIHNQTLVCALTRPGSNSSLLCRSFPQGIQIPLYPPFASISGIVGGNGFLCAMSSSRSSSSSVMVCWRFSLLGNNAAYKRIYTGPVLKELQSGNSHICGLVNTSNSLQCWQWRNHNFPTQNLSSSLSVGEDFVCGLSDSQQVRCFSTSPNNAVTVNVPKGRSFSKVGAGFRHACAVSFDGSLECWGSTIGETPPQGLFSSVASGENRSCAIRSIDGTVVCWGENGLFRLPESLRNEPFIALEAKRRVFCGVAMSNYSLFCWGDDNTFYSNMLVFGDIVPGACTSHCACAPLPKFAEYCPQGQMICQPCLPREPAEPPLLPPSPQPPPPPPPPGPKGKWDRKMVAFMVVGCFGSVSLLVILCVFLFPRYVKIRSTRIHDSGRLEEGEGEGDTAPQSGRRAQPQSSLPQLEKKLSHLISMGNGGHLEEFTLEILLEATDNFSEDRKIGTGSFGSVYHAKLEDEREIAIKRAENTASSSLAGAGKRGLEDKDSAFLNELEFLSRLNHKNLVRLLGYCEDSNERVLVYEYMDNGTLYDHLHKLETSPLMSWATRIKVALDAARGIEYLHEYAVPQVIHRDIKSSNILLDATWTAKVSDFGLSLMGPQDEDVHMSLRAAGTMGYMDPEYYRLQLLTTKSDVYSFGIVLLELLSGCKAIHKNENGVPRNVVDYVVPYIIQDDIHRVLDQRVPPPTPFEIEAVAHVGYLAVDCVMPEGRNRPTMSEVVNGLDKALEVCLAPQTLSRSTSSSSL